MAKKNNAKNLWQLAREVGLESIRCSSCGKKISGIEALMLFFSKIIEACQSGNDVRIKNFGTFRARKLKGRKIISPALEIGTAEFNDHLVLRFHQSTKCKRLLNKTNGKLKKGKKKNDRTQS